MEQIKLSNDVQMPFVGFGTFQQKEELIKSIPIAYNSGYRLFDTSDNYLNEEYIGKCLAENTEIANDSFIVTKFSNPNRLKDFYRVFKESEMKIGRPIDLYLMHWPYPYLLMDIWREMEKLYLNKEVRAIGVCNFEIEHLKYLLKHCKIKPMINQIEVHPKFRQKLICDFCQNNGIQIMSYAPLARMNKNLFEDQQLKQIALEKGKSVSQVILRWNLQHGYVAIPASRSENHIAENFDIWNFQLSENDMCIIDNLDCGLRIRFDPKTRFSYKRQARFFLFHLDYLISKSF